MRTYLLACFMLCVGACATTPESTAPAPRRRNVISADGIVNEFGARARKHAEAMARIIVNAEAPVEREISERELLELEQAASETPQAGPNHVRSDICTAVETLAKRAIALVLERYHFGDGSTLIVCNVADSLRGYSDVVMQPPAGSGVGSRPCIVRYDVDEPSAGTWKMEEFDDDSLMFVYEDEGSKSHNTLIPLDCKTF